MSVNTSRALSKGLSLLTYNGDKIVTPKGNQLNIYMGIGLWSKKDGLSKGLPVDVMHMLLSAAMMRSQIVEANLEKSSKVIILIADSMAIREGGEEEKVLQLVQIYKKCLEPLLDSLNIRESSEMVLSSELESSIQFIDVLKSVEDSGAMKKLKLEDSKHYDYIRTQTAITRYMNTHGHVGIKMGWKSSKSNGWDETKFDPWCAKVFEDSTMQYLYAKCGLKQSGQKQNVNVSEGCPYMAYSKGDNLRYIVQTQEKIDIKNICPIQRSVAKHWTGVAEVCSSLMQEGLVKRALLPEECIQNNNAMTVYKMLNHWANPPSQIVEANHA